MSLIKELQRRNVFRVAAAYVVVAWLLIQVGATLEPAMHLPDWTDSLLAFFLLLGFPVAVFFAWAYELTPDGLKRDGEVSPGDSTRLLEGRKWDRIIIVLLVLALGYFVADKYLSGSEPSIQKTGTAGVSGTELADPAVADDKSIAVLPFVNMSSDPEQEYFSDGLTEELLNLLAKIDALNVAARTSSFFYKDKLTEIPFTQIGRELGVNYLLEGSVRRGGDRIRITAQLIKTDDGFHMWSETWDRTLDDIFAVQDEIAAAVTDQLRITLLGEMPHATVIDSRSLDLSLQGRFLFNRRAPGDLRRALELFEQAAEIDPQNVEAWIGMTPLYLWLFDPPRLDDAESAILRALEIQPDNPEAMYRQSIVVFRKGDVERAEDIIKRALELGQNNVLILSVAGGQAMNNGDFDRGIEMLKQAIAIEPLHPVNVSNLASYLVTLGRLDEAEPWAIRAEELSPESRFTQAEIILYRGNPAKALELLERTIDDPETTNWIVGLKWMLTAMALHSLGDAEGAQQAKQELMSRYGDRILTIQEVYLDAWMGNHDRAFELLDEIMSGNGLFPPENLYHPALGSLRSDPRWEKSEKYLNDRIESPYFQE